MSGIFWIHLQIIEDEYKDALDSIHEYLYTVRKGLHSDLIRHKRVVRNDLDLEKESEDIRDHVLYWADREEEKLSKIFPTILLQTHFLALFNLFERLIVKLFNVLNEELSLNTVIEGKVQDRIGKARTLILQHGKVDGTPIRTLWKKIEYYRDIRNKIAHHGSELTPTNPKDAKLIESIQNGESKFEYRDKQIIPSEQACIDATKDYEKVLVFLIEEMIKTFKPPGAKDPF